MRGTWEGGGKKWKGFMMSLYFSKVLKIKNIFHLKCILYINFRKISCIVVVNILIHILLHLFNSLLEVSQIEMVLNYTSNPGEQ